MGPQFRVSSERLEQPGIEPTTPGLEGEQLNHYTTEASQVFSGKWITGYMSHIMRKHVYEVSDQVQNNIFSYFCSKTLS